MSSEKVDVNLTVNGEPHSVSVEPRELLAQTLRERLDYTSINIGCESTLCGACTIHVDGKAIKSCTRLTVQEDGSEIRTVQTLSNDGFLEIFRQPSQKNTPCSVATAPQEYS